MSNSTPLASRFASRIVIAAAAALSLAACSSGPIGGSSSPTASGASGSGSGAASSRGPVVDPQGPVKVALLAPITAESAGARKVAQDIVAAADIARAERAPANMALKVYDTKGTGEGAVAAATEALAEGSSIILGPLLGSSAQAVGQAAAASNVNVLSFSNDKRVAGGNVWVLGQLPEDELQRLFGYAGSKGVGSVAIIYPTDPYGRAVSAAANAAGRDTGVSVGPLVGYERSFVGIERGSRDDAAPAILASNPSGVLIADAGDGLRSMTSFLAYHDVSPRKFKFMGLSRWDDPANAKEGALAGAWFVSADPAIRGAFESKFNAKLGRAPVALAGVGYDAVVAAATMLRAAQSGGAGAFSSASIASGAGYDGANGPFRLLPDGSNRRSLAVLEMNPAGPVVLDPAPRSGLGS